VALLEVLQRQRAFAFAMVFAILGFAATLNLLNVDTFIVRQNVARAAEADELDIDYLASLSADAVPAMARSFKNESLSTLTHDGVAAALLCHRHANEVRFDESRPWQSFHLARWRAARFYDRLDDQLADYILLEEDWPITVVSPSGSRFECQEAFGWD
jgi:hypothetical protein